MFSSGTEGRVRSLIEKGNSLRHFVTPPSVRRRQFPHALTGAFLYQYLWCILLYLVETSRILCLHY